ncbi:antibiotic ABC transporter ATP-binding protein [Endozoicomonas sp. (ex Bugula neritina AB1)]|nr:antibiotic ABC transporter ATP-binding protein [Endozoicomonas sp. (ex Bugula neritina AB1)]
MHKPVSFTDLCLSFPNKSCFDHFNGQIHCGSRIAIVGRNGAGKSSLLNVVRGALEPTSGSISVPDDAVVSYVPQVMDTTDSLSGGQRFHKQLTAALAREPNVLLLDEPTNHLDRKNRTSLIRMIQGFYGTVIVVSHDTELLNRCMDTFWHIDNGAVHEFSGRYDDYIRETYRKRVLLEQKIAELGRQKKNTHEALMKEQHRASRSKSKGEKSIDQKKWPTITSHAKARRAEQTSGRKQSAINEAKQSLVDKLADLRLPEVIMPTFSLSAADLGERTLISVRNGSVGYVGEKPLLAEISLSLSTKERVVIAGNNGSGKSTLIKGLLSSSEVITEGDWLTPDRKMIGYLDQHYTTLPPDDTVLDSIERLVPHWPHAQLRKHLNDFLFRSNEEVNLAVSQLSGGEKVRLSLAQIAAKTPRVLILDEITNNLDLETKGHVLEVLQRYPGAMMVISHDESFLQQLNIDQTYDVSRDFLTVKKI